MRSLGESDAAAALARYYPQFLDAVDDDVAAPWALDLCGACRRRVRVNAFAR